MKKYLQIILVLGTFFLIVFLKNLPQLNTPIQNSIREFDGDDDDAPQTIGSPQQKALISTSPTISQKGRGKFKDGTYTGSVEDAFYGNYQVAAVIQNGRLSDIQFLVYPNDNPTSRRINTEAMIILKSEALQAQSSQVDIVSGASDSSPAFSRSLETALSQAR